MGKQRVRNLGAVVCILMLCEVANGRDQSQAFTPLAECLHAIGERASAASSIVQETVREIRAKQDLSLVPIDLDPIQAAHIIRTCCEAVGVEVVIDGLPELKLIAFRANQRITQRIKTIVRHLNEAAKDGNRILEREHLAIEVIRSVDILRAP